MARKSKTKDESGLELTFADAVLIRDEASFREYSASERLTGRPVRQVLIVQEVIQKKSQEEIQLFLSLTGKLSSLPNATPLLRAEMSDEGLLLVYEITGVTPTEYFADAVNRSFDRSTSFLIRMAALLVRLHQIGITHGEVSSDNLVIEASGEPSVRGAGFQTFASLSSDSSMIPSDSCPPELLMGGTIGPLTDAYGLGSLAYIAFSGHRWTEAFSNIVDAVLSEEPPMFMLNGLPDEAWVFTRNLLLKDVAKRPSDFNELAIVLNRMRQGEGLSPVITGITAIDDNSVIEKESAAAWEGSGGSYDPALRVAEIPEPIGELLESARDADDRGLTVREIKSGRRPKVVTVHRSKGTVFATEEHERIELISETRERATIEEWRPETMGDAWTVPVEDVAAIVICVNGHRVSMGSLFCNFCGVGLTESVEEIPATSSNTCINGHEVSDVATFCGACGVPVASEFIADHTPDFRRPPVPSEPMGDVGRSLCLAGHQSPGSSELCVVCGARIIGRTAVEPPVTIETPKPIINREPDEAPVMDELDTSVCVAGHPNTSSATFCRDCGARIVTAVPQPKSDDRSTDVEADLIFCSQDHPNRAFARFCRWCAESLSGVATEPVHAAPQPSPAAIPPASSAGGMPGRPFLASATAAPSTSDVSVIFDQGHVAPVREEGAVIRALSRKQEIEVMAPKKVVIEEVHHRPTPSAVDGVDGD
jgi:serine/threonine protein kinase